MTLQPACLLFLYRTYLCVCLQTDLYCLIFMFFLPSLKLECDKLASEKSEMQRHYIMVSIALTLVRELRLFIFI